jgi:hypothetical protein
MQNVLNARKTQENGNGKFYRRLQLGTTGADGGITMKYLKIWQRLRKGSYDRLSDDRDDKTHNSVKQKFLIKCIITMGIRKVVYSAVPKCRPSHFKV